MIGARVLPPNTGSPLRRWCSATRRERFFGLRRGAVVGGLTITSTSPVLVTAEHAEAEPAAEIAIARVALAALAARRQFGRKPNLVGGAGAIDRLQDQFEVEGQLQFADHHDRRIVAAERHEIAAADLALDGKAELFEEAFDGQIKRGFQGGLQRRTGRDLICSSAESWRAVICGPGKRAKRARPKPVRSPAAARR